ncbi:MAG: sigma-54 dependent transcriptional regulator [Desulfobacterales bacterium]|nr:sigma-54 dependent transcriptional regulator [Desulfobacterales bacterium]MDX2513420.1 sigma-54 dependent transcriptional regulator [Desulfobacterales bacterium]
MSEITQKILLVDDEEKFLNSVAKRLKIMGFDPLKASSGQEALALARNNPIDLAIVDLKMPDMDGLVTITKLKELYPDLRSVLLTGYGSEKVKQATEAIDSAFFEKDHMHDFWDFINKSNKRGNTIVITPPSSTAEGHMGGNTEVFRPGRVEIISDQESKTGRQDKTTQRIAAVTDSSKRLRMIGETHAMQILRKNIERVATLDCTVIFRGETGTGKELAARIVHNSSPRKHHRFIAFNCGCFSNDLIIEELFKQGRKAFSEDLHPNQYDAQTESGGTILLDQIEDMPMKMQLSMLKIIDNKEAFRGEDTHRFPFDVRILVASRYSLEKLVEDGKFREELYHRLNLMEFFIPPLRERRDDILPLSGYFLDKFAIDFKKPVESISDEVISVFMAYDVPGNVRELEHVIERAVILADGHTIEAKHLPARFQTTATSASPSADSIMTLADMERNHILKALKATGGNKSKTAELLGISRSALWRKLSTIANK